MSDNRSVYKVEWQGVDRRWREVNRPGTEYPYYTRRLEQAMARGRIEYQERGLPTRVANSYGGTIAVWGREG